MDLTEESYCFGSFEREEYLLSSNSAEDKRTRTLPSSATLVPLHSLYNWWENTYQPSE
jgi:hypothetical protein